MEQTQTPSITVWCGVCRRGILDPFSFEKGGRHVSVTASRYSGLVLDHVLPELQRLQVPIDKIWFQQDGATAHTARMVLSLLEVFFHVKVISREGGVSWPPRSPDIAVCDISSGDT